MSSKPMTSLAGAELCLTLTHSGQKSYFYAKCRELFLFISGLTLEKPSQRNLNFELDLLQRDIGGLQADVP